MKDLGACWRWAILAVLAMLIAGLVLTVALYTAPNTDAELKGPLPLPSETPSIAQRRKLEEMAAKPDLADGDLARELNAARPFDSKTNDSASPFRSRLTGKDRERAATCLAVAGLYEAGGNGDDQYPVFQVILNRARHAAFPNTICGVVFEGSNRQTGCQFSFTCDGSMARWRPSRYAFEQAYRRASSMLENKVDKRVGLSTHYHTDWVLPYWSSSLDKVTAVRSHLFFRWRGNWGKSSSFNSTPETREPIIPRLASLSPSHRSDEDNSDAVSTESETEDEPSSLDQKATKASSSATVKPVEDVVRMELDRNASPGRWALEAVELCASRPECRVIGWVDPDQAAKELSAQAIGRARPDFIYIQELRNRIRQAYWDCSKWPKAPSSKCIGPASDVEKLIASR